MFENKFVSLPSHLKTIEPMEVHRDDGVLRFGQYLYPAVGTQQKRRVVACVAVGDESRLRVVDSIEHGNKHAIHRIGGQ